MCMHAKRNYKFGPLIYCKYNLKVKSMLNGIINEGTSLHFFFTEQLCIVNTIFVDIFYESASHIGIFYPGNAENIFYVLLSIFPDLVHLKLFSKNF